MKIILSDACTEQYLTVDGTDSRDLTFAQIQDAIINAVATLSRDNSIDVLKYLAEMHGNVSDGEYCDQCGDTNYDYTLEVPDSWTIEWKH